MSLSAEDPNVEEVVKEQKRPYLDVEKERLNAEDDDSYFPTANEEMARRAAISFRCIECNNFKVHESPYCACGEEEAYHAKFAYPSPDDTEWVPDCLETLPKTNAVGKVYFSLAGAADNLAYYVRVSVNDNLQHIMEFLKSSWKILQPTRPKLCISILTSPFIKRIAEDSKKKLISEVIDTLRACDSLLINNGLRNTQFNSMIGKELSTLTTNHFGDDMAFVPPKIIGVCPWGCVSARHMFVDVDHKYKEVNYKNVKKTNDGKRVPLIPYNSAFIFGDDGYRGNYQSFVKTKFRARFEKRIASAKNVQGLSVPVVDMVVGGDINTLREASNAVQEGISLLICKGTGMAADVLAFAQEIQSGLRDKTRDNTDQLIEAALKPRIANIFDGDDCASALKMVTGIIKQPDLITIYDVTGEAKLCSELMNSIMMHASDTLGKLYLTLSWRNYELANSVTRAKLEDIQPSNLYGLMLTALLNDELEFVKLFIRLGVRITDFVTVDVLHSLYNFSRNRQTFVANLHNGHCDQMFSHMTPPSPDKLSKTQGGSLKRTSGDRGGVLRAAFMSFLGHVADKKVQSYMDALREEEENRLMRVDPSTVYLAAVQSLVGYNFSCDLYGQDTPINFNRSVMTHIRVEEPADHLTIWAILHGRQKMAQYFLSKSMHPIYLSIFGASIYRHLSRKVASYDTKTMEIYKSNADEIELDGRNILDLCDTKSPVTTKALLLSYQPYWGQRPATIAAATSNCYKILSSSPFKLVVTDTWFNGVQENFAKVLLTIVCPILLITQKNLVTSNLDTLIENAKSRIPEEFSLPTTNAAVTSMDDDDYSNIITNRSKRIRQFYDSPVTHFAFTMISLLVYLALFCYFLLFDLYSDHISIFEGIIMVYSIGWIIENISTCARENIKSIHDFFAVFQTFPWLPVYFVADILFLVAAFTRISSAAFRVSVGAYSVQLIFNTAKLLYMMMLSSYYGPKVVMIKEMLNKLAVLATILFIIMTAYGAAVQVLLFPTTDDFSIELLLNIFQYPYFQLFGELAFNYYYAEDPCNETQQICPKFNVIVPILHAVYMLIAVLIFLNLLIAIFSQVFSDLLEKSVEIWNLSRFRVVFYYRRVSIVPPPFSAASTICVSIYKAIKISCERKKNAKANKDKASTKKEQKKALQIAAMRNQASWRMTQSHKDRNEYGYDAFLYRFQEFCRQEYYRNLEETGSASFDQQLTGINKRLEDLQKIQTDFTKRLSKVVTTTGGGEQSTKTKKKIIVERSRSERLRRINKIISGAEKKYADIIQTVHSFIGPKPEKPADAPPAHDQEK